ncbi:MAG: type II toxin-antitoxin system VapC family toxin [Dermatophilaceae bacterium]
MTRAVFIDTSVLLHAVGGPGPNRASCRRVLEAAEERRAVIHLSAESVQEFLFHRMRVGERRLAVDQTRAVRGLGVVHALDDDVLDRALELVERHRARGRDAVIAATALLRGFDDIVTTDRRFVEVPGLSRVDPGDF